MRYSNFNEKELELEKERKTRALQMISARGPVVPKTTTVYILAALKIILHVSLYKQFSGIPRKGLEAQPLPKLSKFSASLRHYCKQFPTQYFNNQSLLT